MNRKKIFLLLVACGGGLVFLGLCCGGLAIVSVYGVASRDVTEEEMAYFVTAEDMEEYFVAPGDPAECVVTNAKTNIDGSLELEYEYDADRDPGTDDVFILQSTVDICSSESSAKEDHSLSIGAMKLGITLSGQSTLKIDQRNDLMTLGDENYAAILRNEGIPVGNLVVVRQGKKVFSVALIGVFFESREDLESVFRRSLAAAR